MKKLSSIAVAMLAVCLLAEPLASTQGQQAGEPKAGSAEQQIEALQVEFVKAILKGDTGFYQKYYADDAFSVHGQGQVYTKAQEIADLKSGSLKYDSYTIRDQKIHIDGSTAVVVTLASGKGLLESKPFNQDFRTTYVWVKREGNWKLLLRQVTRIPTP
ncbi:MAG: nuclear transport factor 2 family protein [Verrucomicrobia bacterium]|nr:nuclear transport factor 2 family protein [Verrucomicrobiota bacterium]